MSAAEFNDVLEKLPSHLREQVYTFAQFLLENRGEGAVSGERTLGLHEGAMSTSDDFDAPLPDSFWLSEA